MKKLKSQWGKQMTKEALKLALEALQKHAELGLLAGATITAIKAALAQPEGCQCPECQIKPHTSDCAVHNEPAYPKGRCDCGAQPEQEPVVLKWQQAPIRTAWGDDMVVASIAIDNDHTLSLYCERDQTPKVDVMFARRTWVGLTDQEIEDALYDGFAFGLDKGNVSNQTVIRHVIRVIEAKLKEKNT